MQTKYFPSRAQFLDANGDQIVGSVGFYQTGTTTEITTYSDFGRTTANTNPVNVAAGQNFLPPVFFSPADLANGVKVVVYSAADGGGTVVYTDDRYDFNAPLEWADISSLLTQTRIGEVLYPRTLAEAAAGIAAYNVANTVGDITRPWHPPGNALRYGADPTNTTDSFLALQASINQASHCADTGSMGGTVLWPSGEYMCSDTLRVYYDASDNADYINSGFPARISIMGEGCGGINDLQQDNLVGTVIRFTQTDEDGLVVGTHDAQGRGFTLDGVSLRGSLDGKAVLRLRKLSHNTHIKRVTVSNLSTATPYGIVAEAVFGLAYENVYGIGPRWETGGSVTADGIGFLHDPELGGGGNVHYINFNMKGFDVGIQLGKQYDADLSSAVSTHIFTASQGNWNRINWYLRHGADEVTLDHCWAERSDDGGASASHDLKIADSAGIGTTNTITNSPGRSGGIFIIGGNWNSSPSEKFKLGDNTGNPERDRHGPIFFDRVRVPFAGDSVFRCHNTKGNGVVFIDAPLWGDNSASTGFILIDADEAQYGPIVLQNPYSLWSLEEGQWCKDAATGTSLRNKWLSQSLPPAVFPGQAADQTIDYRNQAVLPDRIDTIVGDTNTLTIQLPTNFLTRSEAQRMLVCKNVASTGTIVFEADGPQAWSSGTNYGPRERVTNGGNTFFVEITGPGNSTVAPVDDVLGADGYNWIQEVTGNDTVNGGTSAEFSGDRMTLLVQQNGNKSWQVNVLPQHVASSGTGGSDVLADLRNAGVIARA